MRVYCSRLYSIYKKLRSGIGRNHKLANQRARSIVGLFALRLRPQLCEIVMNLLMFLSLFFLVKRFAFRSVGERERAAEAFVGLLSPSVLAVFINPTTVQAAVC